ncbi:MAG: hypothetical protein JWP88_756 [Flaviaesturariibacter sp.]|nr:hypothetical protein [Flaviaesturariibacter sp.]
MKVTWFKRLGLTSIFTNMGFAGTFVIIANLSPLSPDLLKNSHSIGEGLSRLFMKYLYSFIL